MNIKKKNLIYVTLLVIFIISFLFISILYLIRKNNTSIIIQGDPENIVLENFGGNLSFSAVTIAANDGYITNDDAISFDIDGKTYSAQPRELSIEFKPSGSNDFTYNDHGSISSPNMHFVPTDSDVFSTYAERIEIKKGDRLTEDYLDESGNSHKAVVNNISITMSGFNSSDYLHVRNEYPLEANENTIIRFKNNVISENGGEIILHNYCTFAFENLVGLNMNLADNNDDFYLKGTTSKFLGILDNDNAELYFTSSASQNSFFCGNQTLYAAGKELNTTYIYDSTSADLVISGKPSAAKLEGIDVTEGFLQYLITNYDAFFMAFFGAILALVIDKTIKD